MALQPDEYEKWGRQNLLAMAHGHKRQVCINHKGGSLSVFGDARSAETVAKANVTRPQRRLRVAIPVSGWHVVSRPQHPPGHGTARAKHRWPRR
jgi:hypothetical protein